MADTVSVPPAKRAPLLSLDFKSNGGRFAPTSVEELIAQIQQEVGSWAWIVNKPAEQHENGIRDSVQLIQRALGFAQEAKRFESNNPQGYQHEIRNVENALTEVYIRRNFPHTSTPLAKRISALRTEVSAEAASYYAAVTVPSQDAHAIHPIRANGWRGVIEGLLDRFNLVHTARDAKSRASAAAFEQLRAQAEDLVGDKSVKLEALHRSFEEQSRAIHAAAAEQAKDFATSQQSRRDLFDKEVSALKAELDALRRTFREELALRAPAAYWRAKRNRHLWFAIGSGLLSFSAMGFCAYALAVKAQQLLTGAQPSLPPESWRVAVLVLVSVFAIWAVRLIVRFFLSQVHLATDASERIVMVETYLALLEGDRLSTKEDRQLILQALFRPSADGIVKDEGIPPSFLELLTRSPRS